MSNFAVLQYCLLLGVAQGYCLGKEDGFGDGVQFGLMQGGIDSIMSIASHMLEEGYPPETIATILQMPVEVIMALVENKHVFH